MFQMKKMAASESSIRKEAECDIANVKDFVINIPPDLPPVDRPDECSIYRVPMQLRKVNEEAYTPKLVSIGPFHHGREELRDMENLKLTYLKEFLYRTTQSQENLLKFIIDKETKIRHCYSEECRLNSKDFVQMILLDAIFIIELFLKFEDNETDDILISKAWFLLGITDDLILLENQLPFFVLEDLYMSAKCDSSSLSHHQEGQEIKELKGDMNKEDTQFLKLSYRFFSRQHYSQYYSHQYYDSEQKFNIGGKVKHFTDLQRYFVCLPDLEELNRFRPTQYGIYDIYSATKLDEAGLQFKKVEYRRGLLDIRFPENKLLKCCPCLNLSWLLSWFRCFKCCQVLQGMERFLEVPVFEINEKTEGFFRNLVALEQCCYLKNAYICNYVVLMDVLINTEEDVALLVDKKVIMNWLGSNAAVVALIKNLSKEIVIVGSCYSSLARELYKYHQQTWNRILVALKSTYFSDFGRVNATVATLLALVGLFLPILTNNGCKCD